MLAFLIPCFAQDAVQTDQKPAAPQTTDTSAAASPVPSGENWLSGYIDLGYVWLVGPYGSVPAYKSIVDLTSGLKFLGGDITLTDPKHRAFDKIHVRATTWGDEPYETLHFDMSKAKLYDFNADYRDFAYFNYLPSYADPLQSRGVSLDEQAFELRRKFTDMSLNLWPAAWVTPYVEFNRDSNYGGGTSVFVTDADSFPVPQTQADFTDLFRGGLRFQFKKIHATLEQGATSFHSSQNLYQSSGTNYGNVLTPVFGETVDLTNLLATYGISGSSKFTRGLFTANVTNWLDVYGQFLYSEPQTTVNYTQSDAGNLYLQSQILFYTSQEFLLDAAAKMPHTTGSVSAEMRPYKHVRIVESWLTDRMHNAAAATSNQTLVLTPVSTPSQQIAAELSASLANNYNQEEVDLFWDATSKLMLRGGYRYVWGDAQDAILPAEGLAPTDYATLHRQVGLGGFTYRPLQKLSLTGEAEAASSTGAYFRTSLYNYQKVRGQARYQAIKQLSFAVDVLVLDNSNPVPGVNYSYSSHQESASLFWTPKDGKYFDFEGTYTRSAIRSDIGYLVPSTLGPATSLYTDNAHIGTSLINFHLPKKGNLAPKLSAGGSFFLSSGSRPTSYYQPLANVWLPLNKHVTWFSEWRYYGYGEAFYLYEGFHSHLVTTGLRFTR